jgi:hypothetical protein
MKAVNTQMLTNQNSGFYEHGRHYGLAKKREVALAYLQLPEENATFCPPVVWVAKKAKVGWHYANLVTKEPRDNGESLANLIDPAIIHHNRTTNDGEYHCFLLPEEEMFLLSFLRVHSRVIHCLRKGCIAYGRVVSSLFISLWFNQRFGYSGRFKKPYILSNYFFLYAHVVAFLS